MQIQPLRHDNERRLIDQINATLNSFGGSAEQVAGSLQATGDAIRGVATGATNTLQETGDAIRGATVVATNSLQETSTVIGKAATCASNAIKMASWAFVAAQVAVSALGTFLKYKMVNRAIAIVDQRAEQAIATVDQTANRAITAADQRAEQAVARVDQTANRAVTVMEQKADCLIGKIDAQCAAARQDVKDVAREGLELVRDETEAAIDVVREGIQNGLNITQKTAAISCAIFACATAAYAAQGEDPSIRLVGTGTSVAGLLGIGSYCFGVWAREAPGAKETEDLQPWTPETREAALGLIKTKTVLGEGINTKDELKLFQGNPVAYGLARAKDVLGEVNWSAEELQRAGIGPNTTDNAEVDSDPAQNPVHPEQGVPVLPDTNKGDIRMVSRVSTVNVPQEAFEKLATVVQTLQADIARQRGENAENGATIEQQRAQIRQLTEDGRRRDEVMNRQAEEGRRRDEVMNRQDGEMIRLSRRVDEHRVLLQESLDILEGNLNSTRKICQITCAVGGVAIGLTGGFVVGAAIGGTIAAAGTAVVADSVLAIGAGATAVVGGVAGEEVGRTRVGPKLHELVYRKEIGQRDRLRQSLNNNE